MTLIEAAVDTVSSVVAGQKAGAARIELCAGLNDGGTTPSAGLIATAIERSNIPVYALIRPRGGDFVYSDRELDVMRRDIELALSLGVSGFATGVLMPDSTVDVPRMRALAHSAAGKPMTFHRAFDFTPDLSAALEQLVDAGMQRVLTSGGAQTALEGAEEIARLVEVAAGRITIIAGGGIRETNIREVIQRTGVAEVHAGISSTSRGRSGGRSLRLRKSFPERESDWDELDESRMRRLVELSR